jgi:hypothetical protein
VEALFDAANMAIADLPGAADDFRDQVSRLTAKAGP